MQNTFKLALQIKDFLRQFLGHMDPSLVFTLLYLIIRILGQGLSEKYFKKPLQSGWNVVM